MTDLDPIRQLLDTVHRLRAPGGCPWDRKQTHQSLLPYLIEECYEVVEAVRAGGDDLLKDELGDLLCQIVFHAHLAAERKEFNADDVANHIAEKLIRRHPHVFGDRAELNPQEVRDLWERRKLESGEKEDLLGGLPASMPAESFRLPAATARTRGARASQCCGRGSRASTAYRPSCVRAA